MTCGRRGSMEEMLVCFHHSFNFDPFFFSLECVKESHQGLLLSSVFLSAFPDGPGLENFLKSYSHGLAGIPTLLAQSLRALAAQYTFVMCASLMHKWICPQRMDIYDMFAKTLHPFSRHTPSTAIMFPTVEETNAFSGYLLLVFGLNLRGSLKETKQNTFVTSHVLHVRASLYMSKLPEDQSGSQTSCVHIERLVIIVFAYAPMYSLLTPLWHRW